MIWNTRWIFIARCVRWKTLVTIRLLLRLLRVSFHVVLWSPSQAHLKARHFVYELHLLPEMRRAEKEK